VDTVGFAPGVLSPPILNSDKLHVVERFSLDRSGGVLALRREYAAEDPLYFTGQFRGADTAFVADLPYEPPTCNDLSYKTGQGTPAVDLAQPPPVAVTAEPAPAKSWWMFWK
jgi:hypothetical protein